MVINVDLPAPFSPSSAWISPRPRSKSTASLARTPGNRFVMPRSSRTRGASAIGIDNPTGAGPEPAPVGRACCRLLRGRDDLAAGDQLQDGVGLRGDELAVCRGDLFAER